MKKRSTIPILCIGALLLLSTACGPPPAVGTTPYQPYQEEVVVKIGTDGPIVQSTVNQPCDPNKDPNCLTPPKNPAHCPDQTGGPADLVVVDGKVMTAICYGKPGQGGLQTVKSSSWQKTFEKNSTTITFDKETNGKPLDGGVTLKGNNNTVYGNGPDQTILKGDSLSEGNNNRLRGVTIDGSLTMKGNDLSIVLTVITGNLLLEGNNAILADVVVFGNLSIKGNNHVLMRVWVGGEASVVGDNNQCTQTSYFTDTDKDGIAEKTELTKPWNCPKK